METCSRSQMQHAVTPATAERDQAALAPPSSLGSGVWKLCVQKQCSNLSLMTSCLCHLASDSSWHAEPWISADHGVNEPAMSPQVTAEDSGWCWPRVVPGPPCDVPKSGTGRAAGGTILQDLELQCPPSRRAGAERVPVPRAALGTSPCSGNPMVGAGQGRAQQRAPALLPRVRAHGRAGCSRETLTGSRLNQ